MTSPTSVFNVLEQQFYNVALTHDQILACCRGEIPAAVASQVVYPTRTAFTVVGGSGTISGATTDGFTVSSAGSGTAVDTTYTVTNNFAHSVSLTRVTSGTATFSMFTSDFSAVIIPSGSGASSGTDILTVPAGMAGKTMVIRYESLTSGFTVSGVVLCSVGVVEHFKAKDVTTLGRWIGTFGNSLLPVSGITPLNPRALQSYRQTAIYDTTSSGSYVYNGAPLFNITKVSTGTVFIQQSTTWLPQRGGQTAFSLGGSSSLGGDFWVASPSLGPYVIQSILTAPTTRVEGMIDVVIDWQE